MTTGRLRSGRTGRALAALILLAVTAPVVAADRTVTIGAVERLRVHGSYKVTVRTGVAPGLVISGPRSAIDAVDVRSDGGVLAIRAGAALTGNGPGGTVAGEPVTITVSTPLLRGVLAIGGAAIAVGPMKGEAIDLSISGTGTLAVASVEAARLAATMIGNGTVAIAGGRVGAARLVNNGGGTLDAARVETGDLVALQDGAGAIRASARFTAQVNDTGLGSVVVAGAPRCTVRAPAGGSVTCGTAGGAAR